jgi:hypothetical protein
MKLPGVMCLLMLCRFQAIMAKVRARIINPRQLAFSLRPLRNPLQTLRLKRFN